MNRHTNGYIITYFANQGQTQVTGKMVVDTMDSPSIKEKIVKVIKEAHNVAVMPAFVEIQSLNPSFPEMVEVYSSLKGLPHQATCNLH